jgi:hypothetical protein
MKRTRLIVTSLFLASLALAPAWAQGARNTSMVLQQGAGNAAGIQQTGTANEAGVLQFGRGNTGIITQEGTGNSACLVQAGRNLGGSIQQVGDYQTTGVFQTRNGFREIPVEACAKTTTRAHVWAYAVGRR